MLSIIILVLLLSTFTPSEACKRKKEKYPGEIYKMQELADLIRAANAEIITRAPDVVEPHKSWSLDRGGELNPDEVDIRNPLGIYGDTDVHNITNNWTKLLNHGPLTIAKLAELAVVSKSVKDFPLNEATPKGGFQHVKTPQNYRNILVQIINSSHQTLTAAHHNMNRIRWRYGNISDHLSSIQNLIKDGEQILIDKCLPIHLEIIDETSNSSRTLAEETLREFSKILNLNWEVIESVARLWNFKVNNIADLVKRRSEASKERIDLEFKLKQLHRNDRVFNLIDQFLKESGRLADNKKSKVVALPDVSLKHGPRDCSSRAEICIPKIEVDWRNAHKTVASSNKKNVRKAKDINRRIAEQSSGMRSGNAHQIGAYSHQLRESWDRFWRLHSNIVSLEETIGMLKKEFNMMKSWKNQWTEVFRVFVEISVAIKNAFDYLRYVSDWHRESLNVTGTEDLRSFLEFSNLEHSLKKANKETIRIHKFTQTYANVSSEYLIPQLNAIKKILIFNPENKKLIDDEMTKLTNLVTKAKVHIESTVTKEVQSAFNSTVSLTDVTEESDEDLDLNKDLNNT